MSNAPLHTLNLRRCILFFLSVKVLAVVVVVVVAVAVLMFIIPVYRIRFVPHAFHFLWNSFPFMGWWHLSHVRCCSCFVFDIIWLMDRVGATDVWIWTRPFYFILFFHRFLTFSLCVSCTSAAMNFIHHFVNGSQ